MLELIAQGKTAQQRWRKVLLQEIPFILGRTSRGWAVDWDEKVSRNHARLQLVRGVLQVEKNELARNPIYFNGQEQDSFSVSPGDHFVIGDTTFLMTDDSAMATLELPSPISQRSFSAEFLRHVRYEDADQRIEVLNRLPEVISSSNDADELHGRMVNLLLAGISSATVVGICRQQDHGEIEVVSWDKRELTGGDFSPCAKLIEQAFSRSESLLHMWQKTEAGSDMTIDLVNDWAFVCPLAGATNNGWAIYVSGINRGDQELQDSENSIQGDVKFAELVGATLANLRRVQYLERRQSTFRPFFSPVVMEAFVDRDPEEVLRPRQCEISVLFCDLRGFSAKSEQMSDQLEELLDRVSQALGIMTKAVLDHGGVIGDFHGDSAMGFWGWPLEKENVVESICQAALKIKSELLAIAAEPKHLLHDFQMGIGMATGNAVAGKIGTSDQVKVTAFGPVVNLAARLEGMTRHLNTPIIVDEITAERVNLRSNWTSEIKVATRRLGVFRPFGLSSPTPLFELFDLNQPKDPGVLEVYESGLDQFVAGRWDEVRSTLETIASKDAPAKFLLEYVKDRLPPENFDGVIELISK